MPRTIRYLPDTARRVLVTANPSSGSGANRGAIAQLLDHLRRVGLDAEVTTDLAVLDQLPPDPVAAGYRAVVAAGGDGTVGAVLNRTPPGTPLAVLPLGTENLLAKYFHMLIGPQDLGQVIAHGATFRLDTGSANGTAFLLMAGCGFDAAVVHQLHAARTGHIHHLSYVKPIVQTIRRYQYPELRVHYECAPGSAEDESAKSSGTLTARWLFVVNLPRYAGGLRFVPSAVGTDGLLDICALSKGSFADGLRYLYGVYRGLHLQWPDCHFLQATRLRIEADREVRYQLDGDPGGTLPLEITVQPQRACWLVAERWAVAQGFHH